jgi:hypothetical protein
MTHPLHHFHTPNPKAMRTTSPTRIAMLFSRRGCMTQIQSSRGGHAPKVGRPLLAPVYADMADDRRRAPAPCVQSGPRETYQAGGAAASSGRGWGDAPLPELFSCAGDRGLCT